MSRRTRVIGFAATRCAVAAQGVEEIDGRVGLVPEIQGHWSTKDVMTSPQIVKEYLKEVSVDYVGVLAASKSERSKPDPRIAGPVTTVRQCCRGIVRARFVYPDNSWEIEAVCSALGMACDFRREADMNATQTAFTALYVFHKVHRSLALFRESEQAAIVAWHTTKQSVGKPATPAFNRQVFLQNLDEMGRSKGSAGPHL